LLNVKYSVVTVLKHITSKFFFDTCYLQQAGVPGPLLASLLRAMQRFLFICVFLFFVVVVILAFGEEYGISATNQMFATLAGGFLLKLKLSGSTVTGSGCLNKTNLNIYGRNPPAKVANI
jgi:hypothetical protein